MNRHPGLDPGSRFLVHGSRRSGTPGQARGDEDGGVAPHPLPRSHRCATLPPSIRSGVRLCSSV
ncbi:hypothetical protein CA237_16795 [Sphingomonas sp. ABOLH]|nr:MAG: hypothetical protein DI625_15355 [Sphingomonas sp.]RSV21134.1 hypothetical protein CA237_16795 [Sphingomonas sp. ABOLH]